MSLSETYHQVHHQPADLFPGCSDFLTCFYLLQAVAAEVEQLQVFGHQELLGPQVSDPVPRQVHLHNVRREPRGDVIQICKNTNKTTKHKKPFLPRSSVGE